MWLQFVIVLAIFNLSNGQNIPPGPPRPPNRERFPPQQPPRQSPPRQSPPPLLPPRQSPPPLPPGFPGPQFGIFGPGMPDFHFLTGHKKEPTYLILASKRIRPGSVYRIILHMLQDEIPVNVRASISRDNIEVASSSLLIQDILSHHLLLKVPPTSIPGNYKLRVEGNTNAVTSDVPGGLLFINETELEFSSRFLTILVQTNRPVYNRLQTVRFRILMLTTDFKPYSDPVEVTILDPRGIIMRKWFSAHSNAGAVTLQFTLPSDPVPGYWSINVVALAQAQKQEFLVEKYWPSRFEVNIDLPMFVLESSNEIRGTVQANYTYLYSPVIGNATVRVSIQKSKYHYNINERAHLLEQNIPWFNGTYRFRFPIETLWQVVPNLDGSTIKVEATVYDKFAEMKASGFATTQFTNSTVRLRFLGSEVKVFKPGMPLQILMAVSYHDFVPLPVAKLRNAKLAIESSFTLYTGGKQRLPYREELIPDSGVVKIEFDKTPPVSAKIDIRAAYSDIQGDRVSADISLIGYYSYRRRYIHVYTSTNKPKMGDYLIFHVRNNFYMESFYFLIISKGIIVASGREEMEAVMQSIKTFAVPVSSEMAPSCRIIVYHVTKDGEVLSDSLVIPIDVISRHKISLELNPHKDKSGQTVELRVTGDAGAFFGVSVMDAETFSLQGGNELSPALISEIMHTFDNDHKRINKVIWTSREGKPDKTAYYTTNNYGADSNKTFDLGGLIVFTDANISKIADACEDRGMLPCLDGSCYRHNQQCDGLRDCKNGYDENGCVSGEISINSLRDFRLTRKNHIDRFYDPKYGDWAWINFNLAPEGRERFSIGPVPRRPTKWVLNAVSMSRDLGLGILQTPYEFDGSRPFFITAEMPSVCTRGEQVGIRVEVFNLQVFETYVLLVLEDSDDYRFVHVEAEGMVKSYNPRTSSGEHHHLIWVKAHQSITVYIPVVATHVGSFNVTVEAFTHVGRDKIIRTITVEPDGMLQVLHTSMILDLKNQPRTLKFLDVNVTETPIVPYFRWRRFIYESPKAHVSVVGDVFGPAFPKMPVTTNILLRKPDRAAEMQAFNFAANLWSLHYLRLTNQLKLTETKEAFKYLNVYYAWLMAYMRPDGSFSMWKNDQPSVWLTQYITRVFQKARFSDWEFFIYIDPIILQNAVSWILRFQTPDGSFYENTVYPLDRKNDPRMKTLAGPDNHRFTNISLTAQVLITLSEIDSLPGGLKLKVTNAKSMASKYLETYLTKLEDPYELAITTYALVKVGSSYAATGSDMLERIKREQEGKVYWSREEVPPTQIVMENQRAFIQPRFPQKYDAMNVETAAYALLVFMPKEETSGIQEKIVRWLNSMRTNDGGFISTQDTIIAMEALIEFTFRFRIRDITDMHVNIESSSTPGLRKTLRIQENNLARLQVMTIPNVWGHVQVLATGAGLAILQMSVQYTIDYDPLIIQPPVKAFDLNVRARFSGRNSSIINVKTCQRWTNLAESPMSGVAVFEMVVPTGYYQYQPVLDDTVAQHIRRGIRNLHRIKITERMIHVYFSYLDSRSTCIDFTLQRWMPVANMTQFLRVKVYDYYAPERYNESMLDVIGLYSLSICEVCGSYQCPYCPHFSAAGTFTYYAFFFIITLILLVLQNKM
uniref:Macroglobulin complement-related 1 n=1 Tax=Scolopendra japonica TaxID=2609777 RepID=A0A0E4B9Q3_9MYRI|nr:macroglobulin complement-related 1 [Scolopendra japonica]